MHANIVLSQYLHDYSPLFVDIADAYFDREMYAEASPLYELLGQDAAVKTFDSSSCTYLLQLELTLVL
jgi:general transcription factor 3C polypeptide 3 (transcription factor C subunit 4)